MGQIIKRKSHMPRFAQFAPHFDRPDIKRSRIQDRPLTNQAEKLPHAVLQHLHVSDPSVVPELKTQNNLSTHAGIPSVEQTVPVLPNGFDEFCIVSARESTFHIERWGESDIFDAALLL